MCTYLAQRGATYYFRRTVPAELRPFLAHRREWMISLGTKDRATAKRAIPPHTMATDAEIDRAKALASAGEPVDAPTKPAERLSSAAATIIEAQEKGSLWASEMAAREADAREERYDAREPLRKRLERAFRRSTAEITPEEAAARDLLRDVQHQLTVTEERMVAERVSRAETRRGMSAPAIPFQASADHPKTKPSVPLLDAFNAYAKEQGLAPTTAYEWRTNIAALIRFLGHDDAARITPDDLDRWREKLLSEVTKRGSPRSPRTVKDKYFAALRATLNWAVEKRKLTENVAAQIVVRVPRKARLRDRNFTAAEARAILAATLAPVAEGETAKALLARRWIPWLCAYTGARVNEISQLRGQDVKQIEGIWTLRITPEAGTVKANVARIVPIHTHLIDQGFLAVAEAAGEGPIFYDPGRARKPGAASRHFKKVGERLAAWVRGTVGITDEGLQPNHGWRHTFKTAAVEAGIPERVADAIQGHAPRSVGQAYGSVPLGTLHKAIEGLPRLNIG